jgi:integrase
MAVKPYQEGKTWSFRIRTKGLNIYRHGFKTQAEARREAERLNQDSLEAGKPKHRGPWQMTLAEALQQYGLEHLPALKGARQDANRINGYLRCVGLSTLSVTKAKAEARDETAAPTGLRHTVTLEAPVACRKIPNGLHSHRQDQTNKAAATMRQRKQLARMKVADIQPWHVQELIDAMIGDGYQAATIGLERALLSGFFTHTRKLWCWSEPRQNPAKPLTIPKVDNARTRVLTNREWSAVSQALTQSKNKFLAPAIALLLETAMRASEPLLQATWKNVDWLNCTLSLVDAKAGARDVPLSPGAINVLKLLRELSDPDEAKILPITYEALKAGWQRARNIAGIEDVNIHDLRHTAATRFTLELNGNLPVLKVITGHKTYSQLSRYINVKPTDVARLLHGRPLTHEDAPAGLSVQPSGLSYVPPQVQYVEHEPLPNNVLPFRRNGISENLIAQGSPK